MITERWHRGGYKMEKKSEKETLLKKYKTLTEEAFKLSHSNRTASDAKTKEANDILEKIKVLEARVEDD